MLPNLSENYLTRGFWGDEAWTSLISQLPYSRMLETTAADFHPPGYYSIVKTFYLFLPPTEIVTRSISFVFYLLTAFLVYKLASKIKDKKFALWPLALVLVSPVFFTYAFEARNYTMFTFAAIGSFYFLLNLLENFNFKNAFFFIILSTLGIYTHYFMFFALAAQGIYLIIFERKILLKMIALYIAIAISYLPWIPFLYSQITSVNQSYWISGINSKTHLEAIFRIFAGENPSMLQYILFTSLVAILLFGLFIFLTQTLRKNSSLERRTYILMWFWIVFSFVLASLPGLSIGPVDFPLRPIFFWRYLIPTVVPLSLLVAVSTYYLPKKILPVAAVLLVLTSLSLNYLTFQKYPTTFKQVYENSVLPQISGNDTIVTVLPSFAEVLYYANQNNLGNKIVVLPEGLVQYSGKSLLDAYVENGRVYVENAPVGRYFELTPGPNLKIVGGGY